MGTAFSSSLFGLAGSLVLGFLDLQAGQAQNRFYTELEDWMSNMAGVDVSQAGAETSSTETAIVSLERSVDRLARQIAAQNQLSSSQTGSSTGSSAASTGDQAAVKQSIDSLAAGVQSLVQHMRSEQQMLRDWVEDQGEHTKRLATVMEDVSRTMSNGGRGQEPGE